MLRNVWSCNLQDENNFYTSYFYLLKVAYLIGSTLIEQSTVQIIREEQSVNGRVVFKYFRYPL